MNIKIIILCIIFPILISSAPAIPEVEKKVGEAADNGIFVTEPVFESSVYLHESGKKSGKNIMLIHGIGESASKIWQDIAPLLEKDFHVVYFDLPGFGRSEIKNALYSPENYSEFVKWVYDRYMDGPMYIVGHSLGASVALYYAGTYPDTVSRLGVIDAAGILYKSALAQTLAKNTLGDKYEKYPFLKNNFNDIIQSTIESTEELMPKDISETLQNSFLRKLFWNNPVKVSAAALINTDFTKQIMNIKSPVFIIWGDKDAVAPVRTGKMLFSIINDSALYLLHGSGHSPMNDNPSEFKKILIENLSIKSIIQNKKKSQDSVKKNIDLDHREDSIVLEGNYERINITDCKKIKIINSNITSISINYSDIEIENSVIKSGSTGLSASGSSVIITGGSIYGERAIVCKGSKIDLAGVEIEGKEAAVQPAGNTPSRIIFSICRIKNPLNDRYIHDMIELSGENSL